MPNLSLLAKLESENVIKRSKSMSILLDLNPQFLFISAQSTAELAILIAARSYFSVIREISATAVQRPGCVCVIQTIS